MIAPKMWSQPNVCSDCGYSIHLNCSFSQLSQQPCLGSHTSQDHRATRGAKHTVLGTSNKFTHGPRLLDFKFEFSSASILHDPSLSHLFPLSPKGKDANHPPFVLKWPCINSSHQDSIFSEKCEMGNFTVHSQNTALFRLLQLSPLQAW